MFGIRTYFDPPDWRGSNELVRYSRVYRAQPALTVFGHTFLLGEPSVVVEVGEPAPDPLPAASAHRV